MTDKTTSELLAEIEGQAEDTPASEYTPPEGWRVLAVGEPLKGGDEYHAELNGYIRRIEPQPQSESQPEPQAEDTPATEYTPPDGWRLLAVGELVMLDDQWVRQDGSVWRSMGTEGPVSEGARYIRRIEPEPVWVCEGRWRTRGGDIRNVTPTPDDDERATKYPWYDAKYDQTWQNNGRYYRDEENQRDLVEYIRPIEPQSQPEPQPKPHPVQVCEGRWRTRCGEVKNIRPCEPLKGAYFVWPWTDGFMTFQDNGRHQGSKESPNDLVEYLGPIEEQPKPQSEPQPQQDGLVRDVTHLLQESGVLESAKAEQQIEELRSEVSYVQNLLGESRQRVTQLEELVASLRTINDAQERAVEAAGKENSALRAQVRILQREASKKASRIEFLETLDAGNAVAICDYRAKVEKLQGLVDTARQQLEAAATEHDSLSTQLAAVKAELVTQAETSRRLRIELDAAQQVPADSPELRQLRLDLAEVTQDRDTYRHAHERVLSDLETIRETTKAATVEAIAEWLQPIKGAIDAADNQDELARAGFFAIDTIRHLPAIMRSLTGLTPED